jgi:hypothetical protein
VDAVDTYIMNWIISKLNLIPKTDSVLVSVTWRNTKNGLVNNSTRTTAVSVDNTFQIKFLCFSSVCL